MKLNLTGYLLRGMYRFLRLSILAFLVTVGLDDKLTFANDQDWARWRGPNGNGVAADNERPPIRWDEGKRENIVWRSPVPGKGHASPIVVGNRILLATADKAASTQSVLCYDRQTGAPIWQTVVNDQEIDYPIHPNNSYASSTVATDSKRVFVLFNNRDAIHLTALSMTGEKLWERRVGLFKARYKYGYGTSPIVHQGLVIVANVNDADPSITAYDTASGELQWRIETDIGTNYSTPVVAKFDGKAHLLLSGLKKLAAYDPASGELLWQAPARWEVTCATVVWDDQRVYASGGFPPPQTIAVKADGSSELVWENNQKSYEQSMLLYQDLLFTHADSGIVFCWRPRDGKEMWKGRFKPGGRVGQSASPVAANGHVYITAENGETLVLNPSGERMDEVSRNRLGDEMFASLAICGNQIFARVASYEEGDRNRRQEWLYCIGETNQAP